MWYHSENGSSIKPATLDKTASKIYTYVRKNFKLVPATENTEEHWTWDEIKIRKEDWGIYESVIEHDQALGDVYAALTELAELIVGE